MADRGVVSSGDSGDGDIPYTKKRPVEDEDDEDEEGEDEYAVEKILGHKWVKSKLFFEVKWAGYDETTEEPEENVDGCKDELESYYKSIGGKPEKPGKVKTPAGSKRGRSATGNGTDSGADSSRSKRARSSAENEEKAFKAPAGSWEDELIGIETVIRSENGDLQAYVEWNNGRKSKHPTRLLNYKCPQQMLRFYECHLWVGDHPPPQRTHTDHAGRFFYNSADGATPQPTGAVFASAQQDTSKDAVKKISSLVADEKDPIKDEDDDDGEDDDVKGVALA